MWRRPTGPIYRSFAKGNSQSGGYSQFWWQYRKQLLTFGGVCGIIYVTNLEPAPATGRYRFMIVPRWWELKIGAMGYRQTLAQYGRYVLPDTHPDTLRVKRIMRDIVKASDGMAPAADWQIHVIGGNFPPNAFVLPGGKVFVFQSILPVCANDDGLATVLAHETAHQVCRHTAENLSKTPLYFGAALALYAFTGSSSFNDLFLNMALRLPASRKMETEADHVGVLMMARACYNPSEATALWRRMMQLEKRSGTVPELLSTHPASSRRIHDITELLPEAQHVRQENCLGARVWW